ncbi:MAG: hypothetical protein JO308_04890 [Verrucomicrobia bacterium]|nr:hypothetical protein [Verrucomicrobiota bacterium]
MPNVGLTSTAEPLSSDYTVVVKYTIEVEGLAVYSETYDVNKLGHELEIDEQTVRDKWFRRISCVVACKKRRGFSACLTRCLLDGKICDEGNEDTNFKNTATE